MASLLMLAWRLVQVRHSKHLTCFDFLKAEASFFYAKVFVVQVTVAVGAIAALAHFHVSLKRMRWPLDSLSHRLIDFFVMSGVLTLLCFLLMALLDVLDRQLQLGSHIAFMRSACSCAPLRSSVA